MHLSRTRARAAPVATALLSLGVLTGCPQLLDDSFQRSPASSLVGLGGAADRSPPEPDAGEADPGETDPRIDAGVVGGTIHGFGQLLAHRYQFDGNGSTVLDSVGTAHGTSIGASLDGSGKLSLSGDDQYVQLPHGVLSGFESISIECWVNWAGSSGMYRNEAGAGTWQSLFTFGTNDQGEGREGNGTRYLYLTPQPASAYGDDVRAGYSLTGFNTESYISGKPFPISADPARGTQAVYVLDGAQNRMSLFIDGQLQASASSSQRIDLSAIPDVNNWLGRSQFLQASEFEGEFLDVRIYGVALDAAQVKQSFDLGPDAAL